MISSDDEAMPISMSWKETGTPLHIKFSADQFWFSAVALLGPRSDTEVLELVGDSGFRGSLKLRDCELSTGVVPWAETTS